MPTAPFAELLAPWLHDAEQRLASRYSSVDRVLSLSARAELLDGLAEELAFVSSPTLLQRFSRHPGRRSFSPRSTVAHEQFVAQLASRGFAELSSELPELPRLLDLVAESWSERSAELVDRVDRDRASLRDRFGLAIPVDHASPVIGGSVVLGAANGARVVYKHRPVGMDAALCELLRWLNARGPQHALFLTEVIDRGEFGWMGHVPQRRPREAAERQSYLEQTGMLLCLAHLLGAGDLHRANVRAFGEHPVILDAEVLLRPRRASVERGRASVLATGWLPLPGHVEMSGLACEHYVRLSEWQDIGSDAVRPRPLGPWRAQLRRAVAEDLGHDLASTVEHVSRGFTDMYALVSDHGLPLEVFEPTRPRVLLRPSVRYSRTMTESVHPSRLASAECRAQVVDGLVDDPPPSLRGHPAAAAAVRVAERSAVSQLEFPRFSMPATGGELMWRGDRLGSPFDEAPLARARRFLSEMSPSAMEAQCRDIAMALAGVTSGPYDGLGARFEFVGPVATDAY